ncbi:hypothetical protein B597_001235 [Stutzerimonas stutzeri KOS6]|uniref:Uncharacterized protein n=1 Tax=Stutzerimonas stutzeri KOS6 TaxID=1218352 RepID=A0A061JUK3_STUST|nr:hypothetical protein B597_001235 [Stutzerimonas stutzeri KOS6]
MPEDAGEAQKWLRFASTQAGEPAGQPPGPA